MKLLKRVKAGYIAISIVMLILGVALVVWPGISAMTICLMVGVLITVSGIVRLVGYFTDDLYRLAFQFDLALGALAIAFGVLLMLRPEWLMTILPVAIGLFMLVDSVFAAQTAIEACRFGIRYWWLILISAIASGLLGVLLMIDPFSGAEALMILLGASLIVNAIKNFTVAIFATRRIKESLPIEVTYESIQ